MFDPDVNINAIYNKDKFRQGSISNLNSKKIPIKTRNGVIYPECIEEVWLSFHGKNGEKPTLRLEHVIYVRKLSINIVSEE